LFFFYRQAKDTRKDKKRKKREIGEGNKEERERGTDESLFTIVNVFFGLLFFNEQTEKKKREKIFRIGMIGKSASRLRLKR